MQQTLRTSRLLVSTTVTMLATFVLAGCANASNGAEIETSAITTQLVNSQDDPLGQVEFVEVEGGLEVSVAVDNLAPGFYGLHVHEIGECEPASQAPDDPQETGDFMSAGSHIAGEDGANHPAHAGDLPTLLVNEDGTAEMSVVTGRLDTSLLLDFDGSAVMIHADADNFANVPERYLGDEADPDDDTLATGDAGERLGCGVLEGVVED